MTEERIQHFEKLCDVMHGSEATPKNVLQSLGKEAIAEIRRLQEALKKIRDFAEFEATFYSKDMEKILEYAQEGLGEWEGDTE